MTPTEMQLQRDKGLCYTCDEKFSPSHRCPNKQYLWLELEEEDYQAQELDPPNASDTTELPSDQEHHLSYNALDGSSGVGTMRFQGSINGMMVQILLEMEVLTTAYNLQFLIV